MTSVPSDDTDNNTLWQDHNLRGGVGSWFYFIQSTLTSLLIPTS